MINLIHGNSIELAEQYITAGSVDLIFTDPPYPKEYHYCYEWLAKEAARALKPEGFLITYAGPYWKYRVMMTLGKHLEYFYDFILIHRGNTSILWPRRIITGYKSLLCYTLKGSKALPVTNVLGKYDVQVEINVSTDGDKRQIQHDIILTSFPKRVIWSLITFMVPAPLLKFVRHSIVIL